MTGGGGADGGFGHQRGLACRIEADLNHPNSAALETGGDHLEDGAGCLR
ncbi:hypothetical protein [Streptomyces africanus]|nr:hypothetical protein [Streptomyces africanus]